MNKGLILLCFLLVLFEIPASCQYYAKELLDLHNVERKAIGLRDLTWSADLAAASLTWANYMASNNKFIHSGTAWVGENIAKATFRSGLTAYLFSLWSSEKQYFNPTVPYGKESTTDPSKAVGHYTQIIWGNTFEVGCGIANNTKSSFLVCQYRYAGNFVGNYVYKPSARDPWKVQQPAPNPAALIPPPTPNTYPDILDDKTAKQILDLHNTERTFVGAQNLTWSPTLAALAQDHANTQAKAGTFKLSGAKGYGKNMQLATIRPDMINYMFGIWASQKFKFDATLKYPSCNVGESGGISQYTQVIWSNSKELGCGLATNSKNSILSCLYAAPGNYRGSYVIKPPPAVNFDFTKSLS